MIYESIIIGKGPAGISAGLYLKRAGKNVLIIGKDGGALEKTKKIDNYYGFEETIAGKELLQKGLKQAKRLEIPIDTDEVIGVSFDGKIYEIETRNRNYKTRSLVLATGTNRSTPKIKGIKELEGKGVSYCAICDAFFYRNKKVAVLGNGDYAIKEAKTLLPIAKSVTILTNGEELVENRDDSLEDFTIESRSIKEIVGEEKVEKVLLEDKDTIEADGLFIAVRNCF